MSQAAPPPITGPTACAWGQGRSWVWRAGQFCFEFVRNDAVSLLQGDAREWADLQEGSFRPLYDAAFNAAHVATGTSMLDVGCGAGLALQIAQTRGAKVSGLDAAAELSKIAKSRCPVIPIDVMAAATTTCCGTAAAGGAAPAPGCGAACGAVPTTACVVAPAAGGVTE